MSQTSLVPRPPATDRHSQRALTKKHVSASNRSASLTPASPTNTAAQANSTAADLSIQPVDYTTILTLFTNHHTSSLVTRQIDALKRVVRERRTCGLSLEELEQYRQVLDVALRQLDQHAHAHPAHVPQYESVLLQYVQLLTPPLRPAHTYQILDFRQAIVQTLATFSQCIPTLQTPALQQSLLSSFYETVWNQLHALQRNPALYDSLCRMIEESQCIHTCVQTVLSTLDDAVSTLRYSIIELLASLSSIPSLQQQFVERGGVEMIIALWRQWAQRVAVEVDRDIYSSVHLVHQLLLRHSETVITCLFTSDNTVLLTHLTNHALHQSADLSYTTDVVSTALVLLRQVFAHHNIDEYATYIVESQLIECIARALSTTDGLITAAYDNTVDQLYSIHLLLYQTLPLFTSHLYCLSSLASSTPWLTQMLVLLKPYAHSYTAVQTGVIPFSRYYDIQLAVLLTLSHILPQLPPAPSIETIPILLQLLQYTAQHILPSPTHLFYEQYKVLQLSVLNVLDTAVRMYVAGATMVQGRAQSDARQSEQYDRAVVHTVAPLLEASTSSAQLQTPILSILSHMCIYSSPCHQTFTQSYDGVQSIATLISQRSFTERCMQDTALLHSLLRCVRAIINDPTAATAGADFTTAYYELTSNAIQFVEAAGCQSLLTLLALLPLQHTELQSTLLSLLSDLLTSSHDTQQQLLNWQLPQQFASELQVKRPTIVLDKAEARHELQKVDLLYLTTTLWELQQYAASIGDLLSGSAADSTAIIDIDAMQDLTSSLHSVVVQLPNDAFNATATPHQLHTLNIMQRYADIVEGQSLLKVLQALEADQVTPVVEDQVTLDEKLLKYCDVLQQLHADRQYQLQYAQQLAELDLQRYLHSVVSHKQTVESQFHRTVAPTTATFQIAAMKSQQMHDIKSITNEEQKEAFDDQLIR